MLAPQVDRDLLHRLQQLQRMARETPVVRLDFEGLQLHAKLEFQNPFGSLKDRAALWILKAAIERGEVTSQTTVVESSSGNFASALAFFCRMLKIAFIPVIDPNITGSYENFLRRTCAQVVKVEERDDTGGFLKTRLAKVEELCRTLPHAFWTNQYGNPDNTDAHYNTTGLEICKAFEGKSLDYVFLGVSSGGTISGVSKRVKQHFPNAKIIAVDAVGSVIFGGPPKKRYIPGIGSSIVPPLVSKAIIDQVIHIPERDTATACQELLFRHGLFVGGSSGTVYAAIQREAPKLQSATNPPNVVFLCADRGSAYLDTVYDPEWVKRLHD
jgi:cysteine synthase A